MDRRSFLISSIAVPIVLQIPQVGWTEYLKCGQMVQFTPSETEWAGKIVPSIKASMRRGGTEYALRCLRDVEGYPLESRISSLRFSMNVRCFNVDIESGLTTDNDWPKYL